MGEKIVLDTDILIGFLRGRKEDVSFFKEQKYNLATTMINAFELYYGAYKSEKSRQNITATKKLLSNLVLLHFSDHAAEHAGKTVANLRKKGKMLDFRDAMIGSIASTEGFSLKTKNKKHFQFIEGLLLKD